MTFDQKVLLRTDSLGEWLHKNHPEVFREQGHTVKNTVERVYWHYGYYVALRDVLRLMDREIKL